MKNPYLLIIIGFIVGLIIGVGTSKGTDYNQIPIYGDTGLPKNCRAIVAENIRQYKNGDFAAAEVLESIDRNCGENGYSWESY